jgi:hypothetical protein
MELQVSRDQRELGWQFPPPPPPPPLPHVSFRSRAPYPATSRCMGMGMGMASWYVQVCPPRPQLIPVQDLRPPLLPPGPIDLQSCCGKAWSWSSQPELPGGMAAPPRRSKPVDRSGCSDPVGPPRAMESGGQWGRHVGGQGELVVALTGLCFFLQMPRSPPSRPRATASRGKARAGGVQVCHPPPLRWQGHASFRCQARPRKLRSLEATACMHGARRGEASWWCSGMPDSRSHTPSTSV